MAVTSTITVDRDDEWLEAPLLSIIGDHLDASDAEVWQRGDATWLIEFETKYTVDGLENAATAVSLAFGCRVDVVEEWDNRDSDDQGREAYSYERGVRVTEERVLEVPAGVEVVAVPVETLRQWRDLLSEHPFSKPGPVLNAISALLW